MTASGSSSGRREMSAGPGERRTGSRGHRRVQSSAIKISLWSGNDKAKEHAEVTVAVTDPNHALDRVVRTLANRFPPESVVTLNPREEVVKTREASSNTSQTTTPSSSMSQTSVKGRLDSIPGRVTSKGLFTPSQKHGSKSIPLVQLKNGQYIPGYRVGDKIQSVTRQNDGTYKPGDCIWAEDELIRTQTIHGILDRVHYLPNVKDAEGKSIPLSRSKSGTFRPAETSNPFKGMYVEGTAGPSGEFIPNTRNNDGSFIPLIQTGRGTWQPGFRTHAGDVLQAIKQPDGGWSPGPPMQLLSPSLRKGGLEYVPGVKGTGGVYIPHTRNKDGSFIPLALDNAGQWKPGFVQPQTLQFYPAVRQDDGSWIPADQPVVMAREDDELSNRSPVYLPGPFQGLPPVYQPKAQGPAYQNNFRNAPYQPSAYNEKPQRPAYQPNTQPGAYEPNRQPVAYQGAREDRTKGEEPLIVTDGAGRQVELQRGFGEFTTTDGNGDRIRYVEVDVVEEKIIEVPKVEIKELERIEEVPDVRVREHIVEVPEVHYKTREVEIITEEERVHEVPVKQVVRVAREVVKEVEKRIPQVVEEIEEVPRVVEVEKPYEVEDRVQVDVYDRREVPTVIAQVVRPTLRVSGEENIQTKTYEPVLYAVDVFIPKPVPNLLTLNRKFDDEHRIVDVPPAQYNSLVKALNQHLKPEPLHDLFIKSAQGHVPMLPAGELVQIVNPEPGAVF